LRYLYYKCYIYSKCVEPLARSQVTPEGAKQRESFTLIEDNLMTTVQLRGLLRDRKNSARRELEMAHTQQAEMSRHTWVTEDKTGKCYTYRGIKYCY